MFWGLLFLAASGFQHVRFNSDNDIDVSTQAIVITKNIRKHRKRKNRSRTTKRYMGVIYALDPNLDFSPKIYKKLYKKHTRGLSSSRTAYEKYTKRAESFASSQNIKLDNVFYNKMSVSRDGYNRYNIDDEIVVFYRSKRPWFTYLELGELRYVTSLLFFIAVTFLFLGIIGFYISKTDWYHRHRS